MACNSFRRMKIFGKKGMKVKSESVVITERILSWQLNFPKQVENDFERKG